MNKSIVKNKADTVANPGTSFSKLGGTLSGRINTNACTLHNADKAFENMMRGTSPDTKNSGELAFVPLDVLFPFPGHPFKLYKDAKLNELVESIREIGVVNAIIIRKAPEKHDMYQILSGHNRVNAARLAGLKQIKAEIVNVDDDTAALIVVDSNFKQRETLLPSERAFAFKMQMEAWKRQGKRIDLIQDDDKNLKTRDLIGQQHGLSGIQVFKYIRLTELIPQLLEMLDIGCFSLKAGVDISYLKRDSQEILLEYIMENKKCRIDNEKASLIRKADNGSSLTRETISEIMKRRPDSKSRSISFKRIDLLKFFPPSMSNEEIMQKIYMLLESNRL